MYLIIIQPNGTRTVLSYHRLRPIVYQELQMKYQTMLVSNIAFIDPENDNFNIQLDDCDWYYTDAELEVIARYG